MSLQQGFAAVIGMLGRGGMDRLDVGKVALLTLPPVKEPNKAIRNIAQ